MKVNKILKARNIIIVLLIVLQVFIIVNCSKEDKLLMARKAKINKLIYFIENPDKIEDIIQSDIFIKNHFSKDSLLSVYHLYFKEISKTIIGFKGYEISTLEKYQDLKNDNFFPKEQIQDIMVLYFPNKSSVRLYFLFSGYKIDAMIPLFADKKLKGWYELMM